MAKTGKLVFKNKDAIPSCQEAHIECTPNLVADLMALYGTYYRGYAYVVTWNGENVPMDGEGRVLRDFEVKV